MILRGVKSEGPINTLIAKGLIMEKGRSEGTGRAILYGTTDLFLDRFGLESLDGLPPLAQEEEDDTGETDLFMTKFQEAFAMENNEGGNILETDDGSCPTFLTYFQLPG